jgi:hypothetical protein
LKKKWEKEKPGVTRMTQRVDPARPVANPLTLVFFTKRCRFDFFIKKRIDPADLVTRSKPRTRALDRDISKNYDIKEVRPTSTLLQASSV